VAVNRLQHSLVLLAASCLVGAAIVPAEFARAGIGDAIKKVGGQASKKATEAVDKTTQSATPGSPATESPTKSGDAPAAGGNEKVSAVSTKFDFVPGDKVLLFDDFTQDELGEFPAKWRLLQGNFETAEKGGERWLRCASDDARIRMKLEGTTAPPEFWTLEFDVDCEEPMSSAYSVRGLGEGGALVWEMTWPVGHDFIFRNGEFFSTVTTPGENRGRHHIMIMGRGKGLKMYLDNERDVNVPECTGGPVTDLEFRLWASTKPMLTNVRYADGCRPPKDMLAEGKLVTYGIRFATGSDVVLPESAPVLRQVSTYMTANPAVKLQITGHTDNVGSAASNLDLSKRRAASVAKVLTEQFSIAADRFTTDGKGDTQTVASNAKPEGRAMNRRVEFAKL
jgi:hypothetical protein